MRLLHVTLLLCAVIALTSAKCRPECPAGWETHEDRCYKYVAQKMTWSDAELNCLALCGNLVSISDAHEDTFVKSLVTANSPGRVQRVWLGGHDGVKEGLWLWSDGTKVAYTGWAQGEPNNFGGNQDCMQMSYSYNRFGTWDDSHCTVERASVCVKTPSA